MSTISIMACKITQVTNVCTRRQICNQKKTIVVKNSCAEINLGLLTLPLPPLGPDSFMGKAALFLWVQSDFHGVCISPCRLLVYRNLAGYHADRTTWASRPATEAQPFASIDIRPEDCGRYVSCDITALASQWSNHLCPNFGITIAAAPHQQNAQLCIDSSEGVHAPYASVNIYNSQQCHPFPPPPPHPPEDSVASNKFIQKEFRLRGLSEHVFSPLIDFSTVRTGSFFLQNMESSPIEANLQISPDGEIFLDDPQILHLFPLKAEVVTPYRFAKFIRVALKRSSADQLIDVRVWYQAQLLDYTISHHDFSPQIPSHYSSAETTAK